MSPTQGKGNFGHQSICAMDAAYQLELPQQLTNVQKGEVGRLFSEGMDTMCVRVFTDRL